MNKFYFAIILLATLQTVKAQEPSGYSVLLGGNLASLQTTDLKASAAGPGYIIGLGFNFGYSERFNYQMEFVAFQNPVNLEDSRGNINKFDFGGVQAGLYFNYYIIKPEEDKFYFGLQAGASGTFGSAQDIDGNGFSSETVFLPSRLTGIDISNTAEVSGSTGVGLTGAYNKFRFNLRYNYGLTNLLGSFSTVTEPGAYPSSDYPYSAKLSSIGLTVSYRFFSRN